MQTQRARHVRSQQGFTLVELLVAVSIFGVLAAAGLPHIDTRRQDVQTVTKQVIGDMRWARTRAITSGTHFAVHFPDSQRYEVQRMKQVGANWVVDEVVKEVALPDHIEIFLWPTSYEFNTRGMMITTEWASYPLVWDGRYSGWHTIAIWPSGQIYEYS
jgi:prepilin-type N-terminal cleavage/methylation domain-containing protein